MSVIPSDIAGGRIFVPVVVEGRASVFMLDTGSSTCAIDLTAAQRMGLKIGEIRKLNGVGSGSTSYAPVSGETVTVGGRVLPLSTAVDLSGLAQYEGRPILGVIGMPLFASGPVEIDFDAKTVRLDPPPIKPSDALPIRQVNRHLVLPIQVETKSGSKLAVNAVVDTGARGTLLVCVPFQAKNHIESGAQCYPISHVATGLGGASAGFVTRLANLRVGDVSFAGPPIRVSTAATGLLAGESAVDALLGYEILRRFKLTIDMPHNQMALQPNGHIGELFPVDQTGLFVLAAGRKLVVGEVIANSPGSDVGIQTDDEIVSINGQKSSALGLNGANYLLTQPGPPLRLVISRRGETILVILNRRPLI